MQNPSVVTEEVVPETGIRHKRLSRLLQGIIVLGLVFEIYESQWMNVAITAGILLFTVLPGYIARGTKIFIPPQFEMLAIMFIFASLFLGEHWIQRFIETNPRLFPPGR